MTMKNNKGVTLFELLIVVSILAALYLGFSRLIRNISIASWKNTSQLVLQEEARTAMHYIMQELQSARASSIGIVGPFDSPGGSIDGGINTSFEFPFGAGDPVGWNILVPNQVEKISSSGGPRSGLYSICLNPLSTTANITYNSIDFTVPINGLYWVSFWVKTLSGANYGRVTLNAVQKNINPAQSWMWEHNCFSVPLLAGNNYQLSLENLAPGTSVYFDDISVSTGTIAMRALSVVTTAMYQKIVQIAGGSQNRVRRIRYAPATNTATIGIERRGKLYLEQWNGGDIFNNADWDLIEPNPLCAYVSSFTIISNINVRRFDVILGLENDEPKTTISSATIRSGVRGYDIRSKVSPYLP